MKKYWFKRKIYGWGWYPSSWQGWLITITAILAIVLNAIRVESNSNSILEIILGYLPTTLIIILILIIICYRTGEKPKWSWGN